MYERREILGQSSHQFYFNGKMPKQNLDEFDLKGHAFQNVA